VKALETITGQIVAGLFSIAHLGGWTELARWVKKLPREDGELTLCHCAESQARSRGLCRQRPQAEESVKPQLR